MDVELEPEPKPAELEAVRAALADGAPDVDADAWWRAGLDFADD